jgi:hypothetical protein
MKLLRSLLPALAAICVCTGVASAFHLNGVVTCAANGTPVAGVVVVATSTDPANPYQASSTTDGNGAYSIPLVSFPLCYDVTIPGESVVSPSGGHFLLCTDGSTLIYYENWTINSSACQSVGCWLTGGGAKFSSITGTNLGDYTKLYNWGGNINPGCSPTAGDGGDWNNIDNVNRLHFHGTHIQVLTCGNIDGIPPGSTSPVTPYNYIEFTGSGTLKGIKGNKADFGTVYFWGHIEDRNEPGSNGQHDGAGKDRYFLNVYTNPADPVGTSVMLVDNDGDPATMDPVTITDGNMQIHISSCSAPSAAAQQVGAPETNLSPVPSTTHTTFFGVPYPNPAGQSSTMRFGVAAESKVSLRVFDAAGRMVRELVSGRLPAGDYSSAWNLTNSSGQRAGAGVYFVRLSVGDRQMNRTITITN